MGCCYDAPTDTFCHTLKVELVHQRQSSNASTSDGRPKVLPSLHDPAGENVQPDARDQGRQNLLHKVEKLSFKCINGYLFFHMTSHTVSSLGGFMDLEMKDKRALVFGAGGGLGGAIATSLAREGAAPWKTCHRRARRRSPSAGMASRANMATPLPSSPAGGPPTSPGRSFASTAA